MLFLQDNSVFSRLSFVSARLAQSHRVLIALFLSRHLIQSATCIYGRDAGESVNRATSATAASAMQTLIRRTLLKQLNYTATVFAKGEIELRNFLKRSRRSRAVKMNLLPLNSMILIKSCGQIQRFTTAVPVQWLCFLPWVQSDLESHKFNVAVCCPLSPDSIKVEGEDDDAEMVAMAAEFERKKAARREQLRLDQLSRQQKADKEAEQPPAKKIKSEVDVQRIVRATSYIFCLD